MRWQKTVSITYISMNYYNNTLKTLDTTITVSKNYPIIGEYVVIIFVSKKLVYYL